MIGARCVPVLLATALSLFRQCGPALAFQPSSAVLGVRRISPSTPPTRTATQLSAKGNNNDNDDDDGASTPSYSSFAVKPSELDSDLSEEERTVINVFRSVGPSVAFVTSVMNRRTSSQQSSKTRGRNGYVYREKNGEKKKDDDDDDENDNNSRSQKDKKRRDVKPEGTTLGSGSGFVVSDDGYLVTNYHVIERAYQMNTVVSRYNEQIDQLIGNATKSFDGNAFVAELANRTKERLKVEEMPNDRPRATVYVRINSSTRYSECRVVDVRPDLDLAVLKVVQPNATEPETFAPVRYGSSSKLLVGQRLIAIGNPFGLDQTVTSGVVSAMNREMTSIGGAKIQNCIQ